MKITNKYGLPGPVYNFIATDKYSRGEADISVTELINPPRIRALKAKHADQLTVDASDRFWAALGTAVHEIMGTGVSEGQVSEERLFAEVDGMVVSGGIDLQEIEADGVIISDYKVTSCYAVTADKPEWEAQLNAYAFLVRHAKGLPVKRLQIVAMLRDWSGAARARKGDGYPTAPVVVLPQVLWDPDTQDRWVFDRVRAHRGGTADPCTPAEMWQRPDIYSVKKIGSRRASATVNSREAAEAYIASASVRGLEGFEIEFRPGARVRCEGNYCGVAEFCDVYAKVKEPGLGCSPKRPGSPHITRDGVTDEC